MENNCTNTKTVPKKLNVSITEVENIAYKNISIEKKNIEIKQDLAHIFLNILFAKDFI